MKTNITTRLHLGCLLLILLTLSEVLVLANKRRNKQELRDKSNKELREKSLKVQYLVFHTEESILFSLNELIACCACMHCINLQEAKWKQAIQSSNGGSKGDSDFHPRSGEAEESTFSSDALIAPGALSSSDRVEEPLSTSASSGRNEPIVVEESTEYMNPTHNTYPGNKIICKSYDTFIYRMP
jgi:hypothetical protein